MSSILIAFSFQNNMLALLKNKPLPSAEVIAESNNRIANEIESICLDIDDPFTLIKKDMEVIQDVTFNNILSTQYDLLKEVAEYNLKLKGKNFRSCIIMLLSRALYSANPQSKFIKFEDTKQYHDSTVLASCIEICHNATLMQDDIIDKAETRRSKIAVYKVYSKSKSVFASNFIISRASRSLAMMETPYLSQIFSTILYNLVHGELIQAKSSENNFDLNVSIPNYISKTYYKTASMISQACRGVAVIHKLDEERQRKLFNFGSHFGIAFQVADDILDFTKNSAELGKPANNDLRSGLTTAPVYFAQAETQSTLLIEMINRRYKEEGDVERTIEILNKTNGINLSKYLVLLDLKEAIECLNSACDIDKFDTYYKGLAKLTLMVGTRNY